MPIEIQWNQKDEENIKQLIWSKEWFLKPNHKAVANQAWTAILSLNNNLTEAYTKLEAAEQRIVEDAASLSAAKTKCINQQKKIDSLEALRNDIADLEKANQILNDTIHNYDKSVALLEAENEVLQKRINKLDEQYNLLVEAIRAVLPQEVAQPPE